MTPSGSNDSISSTMNIAPRDNVGRSSLYDSEFFDEERARIAKLDAELRSLLKSIEMLVKLQNGTYRGIRGLNT